MTGGGFGGCCVALVKADCVDAITQKNCGRLQGEDRHRSDIFVSRPAAGATIIKALKKRQDAKAARTIK